MTSRLSRREIQQRQREASGVLSPTEVARIKRLLAEGHSDRDLAQVYMVARQTIAKIRRGDSWGWVEAEGTEGEEGAPVPPAVATAAEESERRMTEWLTRQAIAAAPDQKVGENRAVPQTGRLDAVMGDTVLDQKTNDSLRSPSGIDELARNEEMNDIVDRLTADIRAKRAPDAQLEEFLAAGVPPGVNTATNAHCKLCSAGLPPGYDHATCESCVENGKLL